VRKISSYSSSDLQEENDKSSWQKMQTSQPAGAQRQAAAKKNLDRTVKNGNNMLANRLHRDSFISL
jgi:hypothetical protein